MPSILLLMDKHFQDIFLRELQQQCQYAGMAYNDINYWIKTSDTRRLHYSIQAFLIAAANISKILWPKEIYNDRGETLRRLLDIDESVLYRFREGRNHLEHFDERLHKWHKESKYYNIFDVSSGPISMVPEGFDILRFFDNQQFIFHFRNDEYPIKPLMESIDALLIKVNHELEKFGRS